MKMTQPKIKQDNVLRLVKAAMAIKDRNKRLTTLVKLAKLSGQMEKSAVEPISIGLGIASLLASLAGGGYMAYEGYKGRKAVEAGEKQRAAEFQRVLQSMNKRMYSGDRDIYSWMDGKKPETAAAKPAPKQTQQARGRVRGRGRGQPMVFMATPKETPTQPQYKKVYSRDEIRQRAAERMRPTQAQPQNYERGRTSRTQGRSTGLPSIMPKKQVDDALLRYKEVTASGSSMEKTASLGALVRAALAFGSKKLAPKAVNALTRWSPRIAERMAIPGLGMKALQLGGRGLGGLAGLYGELELMGAAMPYIYGNEEQPMQEGMPQHAMGGEGEYTPEELAYVMSTMPQEVQDFYSQQGQGLNQYQPEYSMDMPGYDLTQVTPDNYNELSQKYEMPGAQGDTQAAQPEQPKPQAKKPWDPSKGYYQSMGSGKSTGGYLDATSA